MVANGYQLKCCSLRPRRTSWETGFRIATRYCQVGTAILCDLNCVELLDDGFHTQEASSRAKALSIVRPVDKASILTDDGSRFLFELKFGISRPRSANGMEVNQYVGGSLGEPALPAYSN